MPYKRRADLLGERTFNENREKLASADAARIESAIAGATQAVKGEDTAAMCAATTELQQASHAMADALYTASGAQSPAGERHDGSPDVK